MNENTLSNIQGNINYLIVEYLKNISFNSPLEKESLIKKVFFYFFIYFYIYYFLYSYKKI